MTALVPLSDAVILDGRPCPAGCTPAPVAATGTPKRGYACNTCLDWGTVTTVHTIGDGVTSVRTVRCPACRAAPTTAEPAP